MSDAIAKMIQSKAYELGYEKCGIIPVQAMEGFKEKFEERIQKIPASGHFYRQNQGRLIQVTEEYPWAKSVVVLVVHYGRYKIPQSVQNHIGKSYLLEMRVDPNSKGYQSSVAMERYLQELGLRTATNRKFGIVAVRWAGMQAGLGLIRRNNFFYTESGSWVRLETWLTDREMELRETNTLPACPENCNRCVAACPTHSLSEPYTMLPTACISYLTTFGGKDLPREPLARNFDRCIYGCDICQDVCPMNKGKWREEEDFPGLAELAPALVPESILGMEEGFFREKVQPKFFYLAPEEHWKLKVNVLNFMRNNYKEEYKPYIKAACENENIKISEMAQSIRNGLNIS